MKYALIIGNNKYDDPKLAQLKTPAADSQALAKVLDDKKIGGFDVVIPLINQYETKARRAISEFLTDKKPDDLVLLYFSGHGILDDRGRLYLALKDTQVNLLKATSIPSSFIADEMDSCRSRRQILILDCCHSGAFARGAKGEQKAITETTFEGSGFGRVVLTASDSTQYALEGDQVLKLTEFSLFTHFLLDGLQTGKADINNDGQISLDEWYDYTYGRVISETPRQVPHKWSYNQQGDLVIARNPFLQKKTAELPYELVQALDSSFVGIRESAVNELGKYLGSHDPAMVELAVSALGRMEQDDSRRIASLAQKWLTEYQQARDPGVDAPASSMTAAVGTKARSEPGSMPVEAPPVREKQTSKADPGQGNRGLDRSGPFQKIGFRPSFWFKWIGLSILGMLLLSLLDAFDRPMIYGEYVYTSYLTVLGFGLIASGVAFLQWFFLRGQLPDWWIAANAAAAVVLGLFHRYLYYAYDWSHWSQDRLQLSLGIWLIGNFILGILLIRKTNGKTGNVSPVLTERQAAKRVESGAERPALDRSFWLKWIGMAILAIVSYIVIYLYYENTGASLASLPVLFGLVTTLISLAQWYVSRPGLDFWWIPVNAVTGIVLGLFLRYMFDNEGWSPDVHGRNMFAGWLLVNFVLGLVLQKTEPQAGSFSSMTGTRTKIFLALLSAYLVLAGIGNFIVLTGNSDSARGFAILYGISAILAGLSIVLKGTPLNFGFIALALFLVFDGINVERYVLDSSYPLYFFTLNAIPAMAAGLYFILQKENWRNIGFLLLAGFLLSNGVISLIPSDSAVYLVLLAVSILFSVPAAIFLFLRK